MSDAELEILILESHEISQDQMVDWIKLHNVCFGTSDIVASRVMQKYFLNDGLFCLVYLGRDLVASYSGLKITYNACDRIFLSTDTMSNGTVRGASIKAANALYLYLSDTGFKVVCGYPNKNIEGLRKNKLGWKFSKCLDLYIMPSFCSSVAENADIIIKRPSGGFFGKKLPFIQLARSECRFAIFTLEFAVTKPHRCAINLSRLLGVGRKRFYYRKLDEDFNDELFKFGKIKLSMDSIDVP